MSLRRFALLELVIWASLYPGYLLVRGSSIAQEPAAVSHAWNLIDLERAAGVFHETDMQDIFGPIVDFLSAYYMLGFGPLIAGVLIWLGVRHRDLYRGLRTHLLASLGVAVIGYLAYPTAPPRLVPGLGIADTVGMSAHDTGSVAGIRLNPYAAMPSMHVGWSILIAVFAFRAARSPWLKGFFAAHPVLMFITVTATGNHYFIDAIAGAVAVLAGALLIGGVRRVRGRRDRPDGGRGAEIIALRPAMRPEHVRRAA